MKVKGTFLVAGYHWFACDFGWAGSPTFCGWTSEKDSSFRWQIQSSGTPTLNTGPNMDHTGMVESVMTEREERRLCVTVGCRTL